MKDGLIDVSAWCGQWPFRATPVRDPKELKGYLKSGGVRCAWISALDAILFADPMQGNFPMLERVAGDPFFRPIPIVDVSLRTWQEDLEECFKRGAASAVRLTLNYHQVELPDSRVDALCRFATERGVLVYLQARLMDERAHHPLMKVPAVTPEQTVALARKHPRVTFVLGASYRRELPAYTDVPNLYIDNSLVESPLGLRDVIEKIGPSRVLFGSHTPLIYFQANIEKLSPMACDVSVADLNAMRHGNASALLGEVGVAATA